MTRVTDLTAHSTRMHYVQAAQSRQQDLQVQISSGKKSDTYSGVASEASRLVSLKGEHTRASQYVENIGVVDLRLQKMESSVSTVFDIASRLRTLLVNAQNGDNAKELALAQNAGNMLDEVAGLLNARESGRYLFSGTRTDAAPIDLEALPVDGDFTDTADTFYYKGDSTRLTIRTEETATVEYGVTADERGFEKLIRALKITETTNLDNPDQAHARLETAIDLVNEALESIPDIRGRIGNARSSLEIARSRHDEFLLHAEQAIGDIENVDIAEAITRLTGEQVTLNASYAAISRLQQISLVNYLR